MPTGAPYCAVPLGMIAGHTPSTPGVITVFTTGQSLTVSGSGEAGRPTTRRRHGRSARRRGRAERVLLNALPEPSDPDSFSLPNYAVGVMNGWLPIAPPTV